MRTILQLLGALTILVAIVEVIVAKSAMHEMTAGVLWVGGWLMIAAGSALFHLEKIAKSSVAKPEGDKA